MDTLKRLKARLATINDLDSAQALLGWDQHTYMPRGGLEPRVRQMATLQRLSHEWLAAPETSELVSALEARLGELEPLDARLVVVTRRDLDQALRLPGELVQRKSEATGRALDSWMINKPLNNFDAYRPHLEEIFAIVREEADALGYPEQPYDALLNRYEPGLLTSRLQTIFAELGAGLVPLARQLFERAGRVDDAFLYQAFDPQAQWDFTVEILGAMGYDFAHGRQDKSPHPFTTGFGIPDVRVTTRIHECDFRAGLFGSLHEGGHALYEQNINPAFDRGPLAQGSSLGIHESQSRLWENLVGRSRPFWNRWFGEVKHRFPAQLEGVGFQRFHEAINRVKPSLIRIEADEVTYSLHIFVRFELELELLSGRLAVRDLPEAWNQKMRDTLGLTPPTVAEGCMQDMHWADASVGYFPTYALGNLYGVMIFNQARAELPDLDEQISSGRLAPLKDWLTDKVYRHGRSLDPAEILRQATGRELSPQPFLQYVREKYGEIYGLE
ncbi:MAG: carboxypeptidase M32 [Candidatus Delongbacteria bacterium]